MFDRADKKLQTARQLAADLKLCDRHIQAAQDPATRQAFIETKRKWKTKFAQAVGARVNE